MTKENTMRLLLLSWLLVSGWVQADEAAVEAMQEYLMFSEYEAGIILPNQIDQTVFETATFIDTRDADQFDAAHIPTAINIEWREVLDRIDEIQSPV